MCIYAAIKPRDMHGVRLLPNRLGSGMPRVTILTYTFNHLCFCGFMGCRNVYTRVHATITVPLCMTSGLRVAYSKICTSCSWLQWLSLRSVLDLLGTAHGSRM